MRIAVFSTRPYDRQYLEAANSAFSHEFHWFEARLESQTAPLAREHEAVCVFVHDQLPREVLEQLHEGGTRVVALRASGFNNVDLEAAADLGMQVVRVPAYSPHAVAEHTLALMLALARHIHRAYNRVREGNFSIEGLLGFGLRGKTVGIIGTGRIGQATASVLRCAGCRMLAFDVHPSEECQKLGVTYVDLETLYRESDVVTLHCPLNPDTHHLINVETLGRMKDGVMLINTSRGEIIDTRAVIDALKSGKIGYLGLDVYEEEGDLFFRDLSNRVIRDDVFARLLTFPNVIITGHQGFFTEEALESIAETTLRNVRDLEERGHSENEVRAEKVTAPQPEQQRGSPPPA